ncbi:MAG: response regulator [Pseudomonadales bacterium]|jgi:two-component system OmpR family response regulator|nr:response regulator [Pseudomonadales bacterium]
MEDTASILVVDDDAEIRRLVAGYLADQGYRTLTAADTSAAREALTRGDVDLVVLDVMMPGEDGLSLVRDLRTHSELPVIMLTALGDEEDRVAGLELGADDYLAKPFGPRELLARIRTVLRRSRGPSAERGTRDRFRFEGWTLDLKRRELLDPAGRLVDLTRGEFDLLAVLVQQPQTVLDRDALLDATRGREAAPFDRSIDVQVGRLRRKIEADAGTPRLIRTVRGAGYLFTPAVQDA